MAIAEAYGKDIVGKGGFVTDMPQQVEWTVWQTMSDADKAGKHWLILNAPDAIATASQVAYNNANSGLNSAYVQGAIDELAGYQLIETIPANTYPTVSDALSALNTAFQALTNEEKQRSLLTIGSRGMRGDGIGFSTTGATMTFLQIWTASTAGGWYARWSMNTAGTWDYQSFDNNTQTDAVSLYVKR